MGSQLHKQPINKISKRKRLPKVNPFVAIIVLLVVILIIVTLFLVLSGLNIIRATWSNNLSTVFVGIIIPVLGIVITLTQWLHSLSPHKSELSTSKNHHIDNSNKSPSEVLIAHRDAQARHSALPDPDSLSPPTSTTHSSVTEAVKLTGIDISKEHNHYYVNWGEVPDIGPFYGRSEELITLKQWMTEDRCRLIAILGMGGIGKTTLAAKLFQRQKSLFEHVAWFSLQDSPSLEEVLLRCIRGIFADEYTKLPSDIDGQIRYFLTYLLTHNCLLVFDNFESVLPEGRHVDWHVQKKYESYWKFLKQIVATNHKSCVIVTSREKPRDFANLEAKTPLVRSLSLQGVGLRDMENMLKEKNLVGNNKDWSELLQKYSGNPLALKLAADPIHELFSGDIAEFLKAGEGISVFYDLNELLDQQFERLSESERELMYWFAIALEPISRDELQRYIVSPLSNRELLETLNALKRRSMIENADGAHFTLQPVIREYVTDLLISAVYEEILAEEVHMLESHALIQAHAKEYIRENQTRLILIPLARRLQAALSRREYESKLKNILDTLRTYPLERRTYAAGNLLNLLIVLEEYTINEYDFSHLYISQAFLQNKRLQGVNFGFSHFEESVFTDTFGTVLCIALHPHGNVLAAGTMNCEIRLWQISDSTLTVACQGHTDWVRAIAFSPNGNILVSGSDDTTLRIWDAQTGQCLKTFFGHIKRIYTVAYSPDGRFVASGGEGRSVYLWDTKTWQYQDMTGHTGSVRSVSFSSDGQWLTSGSADGTIRIWNVETGACEHILEGKHGNITTVAFNNDGTLVAYGCADGSVLFYDIRLKQEPSLLGTHHGNVHTVAFSPDGNCIASGSEDQTIRLWRADETNSFKVLEGHTDRVRSIVFSRNGKIVVSGSEDHTVRFWDIQADECIKTLQGYSSWVHSLRFNHKGTVLAIGGEDGRVRLWKANNGSFMWYRTLEGHHSRIRTVAFSPNDAIIASGSEDTTIRLWDAETGLWLKTLSGHKDRVWCIDFSPLGKLIASGSEDQTIRLWNSSTGEEVKQWDAAHNARIRTVAFSPDGITLASGSEDQTIRIWDVETAQCLSILHLPPTSKNIWSIAFSPNGKLIASGSNDGIIRTWDVQTAAYLTTMTGHEGRVWSIAFSPDGTLLASGGEDKRVGVWDVETGNNVVMLVEHENRVRSVAFKPHTTNLANDCIASGSHDGTVKLWSLPANTPPLTLRSDRPYERMNIANISGINRAQQAILRSLGAIEETQERSII